MVPPLAIIGALVNRPSLLPLSQLRMYTTFLSQLVLNSFPGSEKAVDGHCFPANRSVRWLVPPPQFFRHALLFLTLFFLQPCSYGPAKFHMRALKAVK